MCIRMGRWWRNTDGAYVLQTHPIFKRITSISTYEVVGKETQKYTVNKYSVWRFSLSAGDFSAVAVRRVAYFTDAPLKTSTDLAVCARSERDATNPNAAVLITGAACIASARVVFEYHPSRCTTRHHALAVYAASLIYNRSVAVASRQRWWAMKPSPPREWRYR